MIRKIVLKNYMSHRHTVIEPAAGLTVIIGPNNCGKSALVSALQCLVQSPRGRYMMRHGESLTTVSIETEEGDVLTWRRYPRKVIYELNGRRVERVVPDGWHEHLKLPDVVLGDRATRSFDIHFGEQKSPIFLLDDPPGDAAAFFASSSDAALLMEMQRLHRGRTFERKRDRTRLLEEEVKLSTNLSALAPLDTIGPQLDALEREYAALNALTDTIAELERTLAILEASEEEARRACNIWSALNTLAPPPEQSPTEGLERLCPELQTTSRAAYTIQQQWSSLVGLAPPPELSVVAPLEQLAHRLGVRSREAALCIGVHRALLTLQKPPKSTDEHRLLGLLTERLASLLNNHRLRVAQVSVTDGLQRVPKLPAQSLFEQLCHQLQERTARYNACHTREAVLAVLEPVPAFHAVKALEQHVQALEEAAQRTQIYSNVHAPLGALREPPEYDDSALLHGLTVQFAEAEREHQHHADYVAVVAKLAPVPHVEQLASGEELAMHVQAAQVEQAEAQRLLEVVKRLCALPEFDNTADIEMLCMQWTETFADTVLRKEIQATVAGLNAPPELDDVEHVAHSIDVCVRAKQELEQAQKSVEALDALNEPPALGALDGLQALMAELQEQSRECETWATQAERCACEAQVLGETIAVWADANPVCPTCGAPAPAGRLFEHHTQEHSDDRTP